MNAAAQGDQALSSSDIPSAIRFFTQALVELPRAPAYYVKRSTAYSRLKPADGGPDYQAALRDAEIALSLARERGKRELILSAQMRRGVALYQLERYGDAAFVFDSIKQKTGGDAAAAATGKDKSVANIQSAMAMGSSSSTPRHGFEQELPIWSLKVKGKLNQLPEGDEKAAVAVTEYPSGVRIPTEKELKQQLEALKSGKPEEEEAAAAGDTLDGLEDEKKNKSENADAAAGQAQQKSKTEAASSASASASASTASKAPAQVNVRHEWYQSNEQVVVTLYAKGVPKDSVDIDLRDDSVSLQFPLATGSEFDFTLDPLFAPIDRATSKVSVMSTKIEMVLRKKTPGQKWGALEASSSSSTDPKLADRQPVQGSAPASAAGPSYPTSSRHGAKDWDKLASSLTAKKKKSKSQKKSDSDSKDKEEGSGDESDGAESVDSDLGGGDPVDSFFKKLYANADPDTRRAMIKSFTESQGTALSTNWSEVGKGKVHVRE